MAFIEMALSPRKAPEQKIFNPMRASRKFKEFFEKHKIKVPEPAENQLFILGVFMERDIIAIPTNDGKEKKKLLALKEMVKRPWWRLQGLFGVITMKEGLETLAPLPSWVEHVVKKPFEGELFRVLSKRYKEGQETIMAVIAPQGMKVWEDEVAWKGIFNAESKRES